MVVSDGGWTRSVVVSFGRANKVGPCQERGHLSEHSGRGRGTNSQRPTQKHQEEHHNTATLSAPRLSEWGFFAKLCPHPTLKLQMSVSISQIFVNPPNYAATAPDLDRPRACSGRHHISRRRHSKLATAPILKSPARAQSSSVLCLRYELEEGTSC